MRLLRDIVAMGEKKAKLFFGRFRGCFEQEGTKETEKRLWLGGG